MIQADFVDLIQVAVNFLLGVAEGQAPRFCRISSELLTTILFTFLMR